MVPRITQSVLYAVMHSVLPAEVGEIPSCVLGSTPSQK